MKRLILSATALAAAAPLFAQAGLGLTGASIGSNFFIALLCGVIIAFAIQYLLTALSIAAGVSAIPNLKEKYAEAKAHNSKIDARHGLSSGSDNTSTTSANQDSSTPVGVKVSAGIGIWNMVTTAIALFTGAALAMKLVPEFAETPGTSTTLALTIWGTFFMLLFWLESRFASTLVGGLISTATSGLRSAAEGVKQLLTPSPASQVESVADATLDKLEASFGGFDTDRIAGAIENFGKSVETAGNQVGSTVGKQVNQLEDKLPSYDKLVDDLRGIMNESSQKSGSNPAKWTAIQSVLQSAVGSGESSGSDKGKAKSAQLKKLMEELKGEYESTGGDPKATAKKLAAAKTNLSEEEIDGYVKKIEETLTKTQAKDLSTGGLLKQLQDIVQGSGDSGPTLGERLKSLDKDQVTKLIASNSSLSKDKADAYVEQALAAVNKVRETVESQQSSGSGNGAVAKAAAVVEQVADVDVDALTEQAKKAIANFIDSEDVDTSGTSGGSGGTIQRRGDNVAIVSEEDALAALKRDLVKAMNNPSDTLSILQNRLQSFDTNTVLDMLPVSQSQLKSKRSQLEQTLNEAKTEVEKRAAQLEAQAQGAMRQTERKAVIQAEHARKTASSAAWWLVLSIVVSGAAAMGGALLSAA